MCLEIKEEINYKFEQIISSLKEVASSDEASEVLKQNLDTLIKNDNDYKISSKKGIPKGEWNKELMMIYNIQKDLVDGFYFIDPSGICRARMKWREGRIGHDFTDRPAVSKILKGASSVIVTEKIDSLREKTPSIAITYPYIKDGKLKIITRAIIPMDIFSKRFLRIFKDYCIFIVSSSGTIIGDSHLKHINQEYSKLDYEHYGLHEVCTELRIGGSLFRIILFPDLKILKENLRNYRLLIFILMSILTFFIIGILELFETKKMLQKVILKERQDQEKMLEMQKMNSINILVGGIAHDFNNLLTVVTGYTTMLEGILNEEGQTYLNEIKTANALMIELIQKLRDSSRKINFEFKKVDINEVIKSVESMLKHNDKDIKISINTSELPLIYADFGQLVQALINIGHNSIDAMDNNKILRIETEQKDNKIYIRVIDDGKGMDKDTLQHIYVPYFSSKEKGTNKGEGLGMAIVYGIVKNHKGKINVRSEVGVGTTVEIILECKE